MLAAAASSEAAPITPDIARTLHASVQDVGWSISCAFFALAVGATAGGWVVDRLGSRRVILASLGLIAAANFWAARAPDMHIMRLARLTEGVGLVGVITACPALIIAISQGKQQLKAMALWSTFAAAGYAAGLILATPFAGTARWPATFLMHGMLCVLAAGAAWFLPRVLSAQPTKHHRTVQGLSILRELDVVRLAGCFGLITVATFGINLVFPVYLTKIHPLSIRTVSTFIALLTLANSAAGLAAGSLLSKGVQGSTLALVLAIMAALSAFGMYMPGAPVVVALSALALWTVAAGAITAVIMMLLPRLLRDRRRAGSAAGLLNQATGVGAFIAPPLYFMALGSAKPAVMGALPIAGWLLILFLLPVWSARAELEPAAHIKS